MTTTTAFVGATGGAGTTRLTIECATLCAASGADVAVLDLAIDTQGIASYTDAALDPELTAVLTEDAPIDQAMVTLSTSTTGTVSLCPSRASVVQIAAAKTEDAADQLMPVIDQLSTEYDWLLLDIPPAVHNLALAGLQAADSRLVVTPATQCGADALRRMEGRFRDLDCDLSGVIATFDETASPVQRADTTIPAFEVTAPDAVPSILDADASYQPLFTDLLDLVDMHSLSPDP